MRNSVDVFPDQDSGVIVYEGNFRSFVDIAGIENDDLLYYRPFYWDGSAWTAGATRSVTPSLRIVDRSVDVISLVRDRLDQGLNSLLRRGDLKHPNGVIPVLTASPQIEETSFPVVTVQLQNDSDAQHFIGDQFCPPIENADFTVTDTDGYFSDITIDVVSWHKNGDERKLYRRALKSILLGNIDVFTDAEMQEFHYRYADAEDFQTYPMPVYMCQCTLTCIAPSAIVSTSDAIVDVVASVNPIINLIPLNP